MKSSRFFKKFYGFFQNRGVVFYIFLVNLFVSVAFFILSLIYCNSLSSSCFVYDYLALKPANILSGKYLWTFFTHMFVHGSLAHLIVNMFVLFSLGSLCERIIGQKRFLWFYLSSGLFAGVLSVLLSGFFGFGFLERIFGSSNVYMVGASGAIFGIAGLYTVLIPHLRFSIIFLPFLSLPGWLMIPLVLFGLWIMSAIFNWPIGNLAHFGGFIIGVFYAIYLRKKYKRKVKLLNRIFR